MSEYTVQDVTIHSSVYGEISVSTEQIYTFEQGVIGLSQITKYALLPYENSDFFIMQALTEDLSFILLPAAKLERELSFHIDEETAGLLETQKADDIVTFVIVNVVGGQPYVNAKAPILLVPATQKGCQFVVNSVDYSVREPMALKGSTAC